MAHSPPNKWNSQAYFNLLSDLFLCDCVVNPLLMENNLKKLRLSRGWTLEYSAKLASTSNQHLHRLESGKARLNVDWIEKFTEIYGVSVGDIFSYAKGAENKKSILKSLQTPTTWGSETASRSATELIPLYGRANGSDNRMIMHPDSEIGRIPAHPAQDGYKHDLKFSMDIAGSSMEPMMSDGDTAYAILHQSPQKEGPCIIECHDEALVKLFIKKTDKELILRQFNPPKDIKIPLSKVKSLHAIKGLKYRGA